MTIRTISRTLLCIERYHPVDRIIPRWATHSDLFKLRTAAETALAKATFTRDQIDRTIAQENLTKIKRLTAIDQ